MSTKTKSQDKHKMSEIDEQILRYFDIKRVSYHVLLENFTFVIYKEFRV